MMKKVGFISLFFCLSLVLHGQRFVKEEPTTLQTTQGELKGTLRDAGNKSPVVIVIVGSGPTDRNGNSPLGIKCDAYKQLAEDLYSEGISTLCFDKRGIGESSKAMIAEKDLRFTHLVDDVKAWVKLLAKDQRFSSIIIAGHSEGSLIGMLAAQNNPQVAKYISIAGAAEGADQLLKQQLAAQPEAVKKQIYDMIDQLKSGKTISNVPVSLHALFRPDVQPYMISWLRYTPSDELKKLKQPVLIVQGTTDIQVDEKQGTMLHAAKPNAQLALIKDMNHVLKHCPSMNQLEQQKTYQSPTPRVSGELVKRMAEFIKKKTP